MTAKLLSVFNAKYLMLTSFMLKNLPKSSTHGSMSSCAKSMLVTRLMASNKMACSALFLLKFFTVSVPNKMLRIALSWASRRAGSSGVGKYCKIFMHFTWSQGEGIP